MSAPRLFLCVLVFILSPATPSRAETTDAPTLEIEVNARELPRRLLRSRIKIPAQPGELKLWYPKWIPGTHGPYGRAEDIGGLRVTTGDGAVINWTRDEVELNCIHCTVPAGANAVVVDLDMICNGPGMDGVDCMSYGNSAVGVINWNTCLMYPEGPPSSKQQVRLALQLPPKWHHASALKTAEQKDGRIQFETTSLENLIDCPLIAGEKLRTFKLDTGPNPPVSLHIISESQTALQLDQKVVDAYSKLVKEAGALFGASHYPEYHFLVWCSDDLGYCGLEHSTSSLNGVRERDLVDDSRRKGFIAYLLPHEYAHSWCGKFRRPKAMCTPDFHTPQRTKLLWVYEGLTQYLGNVLMTRCGLATPDEYRDMMAMDLSWLSKREGRRWRPLEDTAVANWVLRMPSRGWNDLRRSQDYYDEGALLWLEADTIIRDVTRGERSLDDFCKKFMGPIATNEKVVPYEFADIVTTMKEVADYDWENFFQSRVSRPLEKLPMDVIGRCGYRLQYTQKPSELAKKLEQQIGGRMGFSARDSVGIDFLMNGRIRDVVPGSSADKAGLAPDMEIVGVNGRKFSRERLDDALADSVANRKIEFLVLDQDLYRTVAVEYGDGPRYLELVRDNDKPDLLSEILKPRVK